jgi:hypothetical protein
MAAKTHGDILFVAHTLSQEKKARRPDVRALLRHRFVESDDVALNRSIDFALRSWLTMNVREECFSLHTPRTPTMEWDDAASLAEFVGRNFPDASPAASTTSLQFDHAFTVASMNRLSGIEVEWTPCLADHLRFDKRRRIVRIYPFKQILLDQLEIWERASEKPETETRLVAPSHLCFIKLASPACTLNPALDALVSNEISWTYPSLFPHLSSHVNQQKLD